MVERTPTMKTTLPVPEFVEEDEFSFTFKKPLGNHDTFHLRRPPKLQTTLNRSVTGSIAKPISFRRDGSRREQLSSLYDHTKAETYYEQCFEQLSKVGEGSFGEVFKVRSRADGRLYAVKKSKMYFRSMQCRHYCLEEVRQHEQFSDHENCIKLYQAWQQNDRLYMQMELCRENLEVYAREEHRLSDERIWSILLDLLLALRSLHDRNLIHLDIKLDNILVTDDGTCKLADFGLVFDLSKGITTNAREGDSRYLAPELMASKYTKAADIFSLGIATLELACNLELPRNGLMWQRLRSGELPDNLVRMMSTPLREIVEHMMKPLPEDRPTVDALLMHPIIRKLNESRQRRRLRSYFSRKLSNLWRFVLTAVMWFTACLRLQHRKQPIHTGTNRATNEQHRRKQDASNRGCGTNVSTVGSTRNGVSFGASQILQDQVASLMADDQYDDSFGFDSSACSTNAGEERSHNRDRSTRAGRQADTDDNDNESEQLTPKLNNSIPTHTPTVRIVNSTPFDHILLQNSRNASRHLSRISYSPSKLLWSDEDVNDSSGRGGLGRINYTTSPISLDKQPSYRVNDSDSDIRPLASSMQDLNGSVQEDEMNGHLSSSDCRDIHSISSTPKCSLLHSPPSNTGSAGASAIAGCDSPLSSYASFLTKKKLRFKEDDDSE